MRAAVVGAGIGGLATALALRRVGVEPLVIERVAQIREAGAGLSLWPNAMNALRELGVEDRVRAAASRIDRNVSRSLSGRPIVTTELSDPSRAAGADCVCVHRATLQQILLEELPSSMVRTGARCVDFDDAAAILEDGERIESDFLVAADGINSAIRERLHGPEAPRYAGYTCWRGICDGHGILPDGTALLVVGQGSQFGLWPCGEGQYYWFLTKNAPPGTKQTKADVVALCRRWAAPIPEVVGSTPEDAILQNDILDRPPLRWWGRGCVTLLGDAAHATTPNLGQGACQAIEDAVVLADCIQRIHPVEAALREYERLRIPRTTMVVRNSWQSGRMLQLDQPILEALRNWFMGTSLGKGQALRMFRELMKYRVPELRA